MCIGAGALTQVDFVSDQYDGYRQDIDGILLLHGTGVYLGLGIQGFETLMCETY